MTTTRNTVERMPTTEAYDNTESGMSTVGTILKLFMSADELCNREQSTYMTSPISLYVFEANTGRIEWRESPNNVTSAMLQKQVSAIQ